MINDPSTLRACVAEMQKYAAVCDAVDGGTEDMRELGKTYLPKWKNEEEEDWLARLNCSTLFPAFSKALDTMVGRPFGEPMAVDGPSSILAHCENIDLAGRDLDTFCAEAFRSDIKDGITWILVDNVRAPEGITNLAQEKAAGIRPFWVHIPLERVIGWRTQTVAGKVVLTQFRYWECVEVEDGPWGVAEDKRVRVLFPGGFQVWAQRGEKKEWVMIEEGITSLQEIPVVAAYTGREGFFEAEPPLADLAWENVNHWQITSDYRNILHKSCVPFLAADKDLRSDPNTEVAFKSGIFVGFENLHAVSFDSEPIATARTAILDSADNMRRIAGEALSAEVEKTATQSNKEAKEGGSRLKSWVRGFQDAVEQCFIFHGQWMKESTPVTVKINTEWDDDALTAEVLAELTKARQAGLVSQEVYSHNVQQAGLMPEGRTLEDEIAALESEGPKLMSKLPTAV